MKQQISAPVPYISFFLSSIYVQGMDLGNSMEATVF